MDYIRKNCSFRGDTCKCRRVRHAPFNGLDQKQEGMLGRYAQHHCRRKYAASSKGLHCLFEVKECCVIDGWDFRSEQSLVRRNIMKEVGLLVSDYPPTKLSDAEEGEFPVSVIQAEGNDPLAKQRPEHLQKSPPVVGRQRRSEGAPSLVAAFSWSALASFEHLRDSDQ